MLAVSSDSRGGIVVDPLAAVTIPLTAEQSEEIAQAIREQADAEPKRVFACVARNEDDPPLFDLRVILQF
jgi:hypothetical protein